MPIRAEFRCASEIHKKWRPEATAQSYEFTAVYDPETPEDQRFAKARPSGSLTIQADNPDAIFEPGRCYYLDFTPTD